MRLHTAIGLFVLAPSLFACTIDARVDSGEPEPTAASEIKGADTRSGDIEPGELRFAVPATDLAKQDTLSATALPDDAREINPFEQANQRVFVR